MYCELEPAKTVSKQIESIKPKEYIKEVSSALERFPETEVITITANGEPTLYPYLDELVEELNKIKKDKKLLILSNASLIDKEDIAKTLKKINIVKLSLDCATKECFKKLDRFDKSIDPKNIINGIINFSKEFKNDLVIEILFVDKINNKQKELTKLHELLKIINPKRIDIGTIDRPPAYDVKPVSYDELCKVADILKGQNISIAHRQKRKLDKFLNENEILNLLDKRPQTKDDIENLLNGRSKKIFDELLQKELIKIVNIAGLDFYEAK